MSDVLDRPAAKGHNSAAMGLVSLDTQIIEAQLAEDHESFITKKADLLAGVCRLIKTYGKVEQVDALPAGGKAGDIVLVVTDGVADTWMRFVGKAFERLAHEQVVNLLLPTVVIPDAPTAERITSFVSQLKKTEKAIEAIRGSEKKPFDDAAAAVQAFFKKGLQDPLLQAAKGLEGCLTAYQREQIRLERLAREAEAKRLQEEAEAAAAAAVRTEHTDLIDNAVQASQDADKAARRAAAPVADMGRVSGSLGGVAASITTWDWEITAEALIPKDYYVLDRERINREVKALKHGFNVPGIKVIEDIKASVR
jgi:hypothetical protein